MTSKLIGTRDIEPEKREENDVTDDSVDEQRDAEKRKLLGEAITKDKPRIGLSELIYCRLHHVFNANRFARIGSVYQIYCVDLPQARPYKAS
jgi:hypothetical protein